MTIQLNGKTPTKICMFQPRLPAEYQEVEYIESSGTQYIDSGIPGSNGYIAEAKIVFNDVGGTQDDAYFLGSGGSYPNYAAYITKQGQGVRRWRQAIANDQYIVGGSVTTNTEYVVKSTILTSGNSLIVNGSTIGTKTYSSSYNNGYNLWIFAMNSVGAIGNPFKGKAYYLKIWQGNENNLVRDFVPCYRKSDNVIGMYDLVNDVFYTNSGTGTFTKGNDVNGIEKEIKKIVVFPDGVTEKQIRPVVQPKTFTVTFTETSSPSGFSPIYSDDAAGLTAGSTDFDEFFGYSAVRLSTAGVETAEITQTQSGGAGKLDITQLGTLTSGDNVMIKFPVRGIKMTKNGSTITLSITEETGRESEGYQYYAFQKTGDIETNASATVATSPLYLGTYLSYRDGSTLKSWSGKTPQGNYTMGNAITYAGNNGTGYTITGFYQRELINAYYMMKYGNPDCQSVIGRGFVDGNSAATATGGTNSQTNATYGESTGKYSVKLFGLEDWRGNQHQRVGGLFTDGSKNLYTAIHDFTANMSTSESQYKNTGVTIAGNGDISAVAGTNKGMFCQTAIVSNSNYDTYWCDYGRVDASHLANAGGAWSNSSSAGAFRLNVDRTASDADAAVGARLMFI